MGRIAARAEKRSRLELPAHPSTSPSPSAPSTLSFLICFTALALAISVMLDDNIRLR